MAPPNSAQSLPADVCLLAQPGGQLIPSQSLVQLLSQARSAYDWPARTGAQISQQRIRDLEALVGRHLANLIAASAHQIVVEVSRWAGNNARSHARLVAATAAEQAEMFIALEELTSPNMQAAGIDRLCGLRGISLVIASKIYRFCVPTVGAAVDRHASYFFNSLPITASETNATDFRRGWSTGSHTVSRLAIYSPSEYSKNRDEYLDVYLLTLAGIANELNRMAETYHCAATLSPMSWTPADVEMAAYYWWACNGAR